MATEATVIEVLGTDSVISCQVRHSEGVVAGRWIVRALEDDGTAGSSAALEDDGFGISAGRTEC